MKRGELQCQAVRFWSPLWFYCPCLRYFYFGSVQTLKANSNVGSWETGIAASTMDIANCIIFLWCFFWWRNFAVVEVFSAGKIPAMFWDYADGNLPDLQCCARTSAVCSVCVKEVARIIGDRYVLYSIRVQRRYEGWFTPRPCMEFADCTAFRFLAFEQL